MQRIMDCPHQINPNYHDRLTHEQDQQVNQICELLDQPNQKIPIIVDGLLRIVLRHQCDFNT